MPRSTAGGIGSLVGTLLRAYLQGRGERTGEQSFRDVFSRVMGGPEGTDSGSAPQARPNPFTEENLGPDGAVGPAQAIQRTGGFIQPTGPQRLPAGYTDRSGPTTNTQAPSYFQPMPTQEPGLWGALKGVGSDIMGGLTPGNPYALEHKLALLSLQEKLRQSYEQAQQAAMLQRMMGLEAFKRSFPPTEEQQAHTTAEQARAGYYNKRAGQVGQAPAMNPMQQQEYDFAKQHGYKMGTGPEKPVNSKQQAFDAVQRGEALPGMSMDETRALAGIRQPPPPSAMERKQLADLYDLQNEVGQLKDLFGASGGSFTGVEGRLSRVGELTGQISPDNIRLRRISQNISDQLLRARSGAQINEQEYKRLSGLVPLPNDADVVFATKLMDFERELNTLVDLRHQVLQESGVRVPTGPGTNPATPASPGKKAGGVTKFEYDEHGTLIPVP